jgi:lysophospholipase L1-like esterase
VRSKILIVLVATAVPFVMLELGLRLYHAYVRAHSPYRHADQAAVVFVGKAHGTREMNALGFRDHERATHKPAGVFRIVVVGDSITHGYGVDFVDIYPRRLEALLNAHERRFEVVSFGMNQYSTVQEVALFKALGVNMGPDLVIVAYTLNDPTADGSINDFFRRDRAPSLALGWLTSKARIVFGVEAHRRRVTGCRGFDYYSSMHCDRDRWAAVSEALGELETLSRQHGFPVLLVVFPLLENGVETSFAHYRWGTVHAQVIEEATRRGFASLDLLPHFAAHRPADLKVLPTDMLHPNGLGHRIAAAAIHRAVIGRIAAAPSRGAPRETVGSEPVPVERQPRAGDGSPGT